MAGVESVGVSTSITMDGNSSNDPIFVEDFPGPEGQLPPIRRFKYVGERYFETMGNPIVAGRGITWADVHTAASVVVIGENLAREYWDNPAQAIGRRIRQTPTNLWREIVGVVGTERQDGPTRPAPAIVYWPMLVKNFWDSPIMVQRSLGYAIRSSRLQSPGFLAEIQRAVGTVNPNLPLARVRTLSHLYERSMAQTSFVLVILGIAAAVTLLLGVVGIYGVIAYNVSQRRREVGIRMALGAHSGDVQRIFVIRGVVLTGTGLLVGIVGAAAVARLLGAVLFGVSPFDAVTYAVVVAGLSAVALLATWLPARQATRIDPMTALRSEG